MPHFDACNGRCHVWAWLVVMSYVHFLTRIFSRTYHSWKWRLGHSIIQGNSLFNVKGQETCEYESTRPFYQVSHLVGKSARLMIEKLRVWILAGVADNFLLQSQLCVLTVIRCPFHPHVTKWLSKDSSHSAKSAGGKLHLNIYMHTPLTRWSQSGLTIPLSRHSVGTYPEMSSHATCQGTFGTDSHLSLLSHCGLILA